MTGAVDASGGSGGSGLGEGAGAGPAREPVAGPLAVPGARGPAAVPVRERAPHTEAEPVPAALPEVGAGEARTAGDTSPVRRPVSAVRERVAWWVRLRCGMAPRTPVVLGLVLLAAVAAAAFHFWSARPQTVHAPEPVAEEAAAVGAEPEALRSGAPDPVPRPAGGEPSSARGSSGGSGQIVVDVSGKVRRPGVRRLPMGSRVADALEAAGGVRAGTDLAGLNRARVLTDGEQVLVGLPPGPPLAAAAGGGAGAGGEAGGSGPTAPLSLNTATAEQLETLPGVGPVLAQHMIDYRTENNGFRSVEELRQVNGIGERRFADLQPLVRP
nr:ComEA family DNA-binding protein [Streptomyces sp. DH8]